MCVCSAARTKGLEETEVTVVRIGRPCDDELLDVDGPVSPASPGSEDDDGESESGSESEFKAFVGKKDEVMSP